MWRTSLPPIPRPIPSSFKLVFPTSISHSFRFPYPSPFPSPSPCSNILSCPFSTLSIHRSISPPYSSPYSSSPLRRFIIGIETSFDDTAIGLLEIHPKSTPLASPTDSDRLLPFPFLIRVLSSIIMKASHADNHKNHDPSFQRDHHRKALPVVWNRIIKDKNIVNFQYEYEDKKCREKNGIFAEENHNNEEIDRQNNNIKLVSDLIKVESEEDVDGRGRLDYSNGGEFYKEEDQGISDIEVVCIGITRGPGQLLSLTEGIHFLRIIHDKYPHIPIYPIHHIIAHSEIACYNPETLKNPFFPSKNSFYPYFPLLPLPYLALILSGGHSQLHVVRCGKKKDTSTTIPSTILCECLDDAIGECFDKVSRGLVPKGEKEGGNVMEQMAKKAMIIDEGERCNVKGKEDHVVVHEISPQYQTAISIVLSHLPSPHPPSNPPSKQTSPSPPSFPSSPSSFPPSSPPSLSSSDDVIPFNTNKYNFSFSGLKIGTVRILVGIARIIEKGKEKGYKVSEWTIGKEIPFTKIKEEIKEGMREAQILFINSTQSSSPSSSPSPSPFPSHPTLSSQLEYCRSFLPLCPHIIPPIAYSFQSLCTSHLTIRLHHTLKRWKENPSLYRGSNGEEVEKCDHIVMGGGVAANDFIREKVNEVCRKHKIQLVNITPSLCGDNGMMIAVAAARMWEEGREGADINTMKGKPKWSVEDS